MGSAFCFRRRGSRCLYRHIPDLVRGLFSGDLARHIRARRISLRAASAGGIASAAPSSAASPRFLPTGVIGGFGGSAIGLGITPAAIGAPGLGRLSGWIHALFGLRSWFRSRLRLRFCDALALKQFTYQTTNTFGCGMAFCHIVNRSSISSPGIACPTGQNSRGGTSGHVKLKTNS